MRLPTEVTQGYITEVNERAIAWVESLSETMDKGLVLLIDYGIGREECSANRYSSMPKEIKNSACVA
jgi:SAM-dependent MidA family methyltransferase